MTKKILTIAGSDTWGGGGIATDLKTFENFGTFGLAVITSIAVTSNEVFQLISLDEDLVKKQLQTIEDTFPLSGVKLGFLGNEKIISLVENFCQTYRNNFPIVLDPVLAFKETTSSSSKSYLKSLENLIPYTALLTPNLREGELLMGKDLTKEYSFFDLGKDLAEKYQTPILLKGGARLKGDVAKDLLQLPGKEPLLFTRPFLSNKTVNGAGCSLSSAIAASLARGFSLEKSVAISLDYVKEAISGGVLLQEDGNVWHQGLEADFHED